MKILVTGGCGFFGHHLVEHLIKNTNHEIVVLDRLTYASFGFDRLRDISCFDSARVRIFTYNFENKIGEFISKEIGDIDYIFHVGAETHVDRSIIDPLPFIKANVFGTYQVLEYAKSLKSLKKMFYFSTDEIFGPAPEGVLHKEWDRYNSSNPYAATKAGGEELCLAYANTYKVPIIITHTMNLYGERQHPEKFIPSTIRKILKGERVIIHANKDKTKAGSRFYIHCRNVADALMFLMDKGEVREKYNIVGEKEVDNLELAQFIAKVIGKPLKYELVDFHSSRPGHDLRYALDGTKMKELGWNIPKLFEESLTKTVQWMINPGCKRWLSLE